MLFAGTTGAGFVAADFRGGADILFDGHMVRVAMVAVRAMDVARLAVIVLVVIMVMVAIRAVDVGDCGFDRVGHGKGLCRGLVTGT